MIKVAAAKEGGGNLLGFGLSARNVELLKSGKPIVIRAGDLGGLITDDIMIFYGETEDLMIKQIDDLIGPETTILTPDPEGGP